GRVGRDGDEVGTGRLVLLHDPAGHQAWDGTMRLVTYVTAELEPELASDPLLPAVGWSWLTDALTAQETRYTAIGGTVTQTSSTRFGDLAGPPTAADLEIRASWTPLDDDLAAHLEAWCALLASTAGLPPPGVTALTDRLSQRICLRRRIRFGRLPPASPPLCDSRALDGLSPPTGPSGIVARRVVAVICEQAMGTTRYQILRVKALVGPELDEWRR